MPYSGPSDESLPENVKKLPEDQRAKWVKTFNSTFKNCRNADSPGGAGTEKECESLAAKFANGSIKKEFSMDEIKEGLSMGEKYYSPSPVVVEVVEQYVPFGGAQTFEEVEEWEKANEKKWEIEKTLYTATDLMQNVMRDDDLENKPDGLQKVVDGLRGRITALANKVLKFQEADKQTTKTEDGVKFKASDYAVVPDLEKSTTWKLRLAEGSSGNFTVKQVAMAITAMQPGGFRGEKVELEPGDKAQAVKRITTAIGKVEGTDDQKENLRRRLNKVKELPKFGHFMILKDKSGNPRWLGIPSNKWRDRDNPPQIIEEKAHKEFVEYLDRTKDYPVLLSWHTPGTRLGVADFAEYSDGFLVMGGPIDKDKYKEAQILAAKCQSDEIGMSHGFVYTYSNRAKEMIGKYRTWEVSHLPVSKAANVWTSIDILTKEVSQMFDSEKRNYLVGIHGEDVVASFEAKVGSLKGDLDSLGVEYKDISEISETFPTVKPEALIEAAVKAIVETESFKAMVSSVAVVADAIKELKETIIPDLQKRIEGAEGIAKEAKEKSQKSIDDIVAGAMTGRATVFQASIEGKGLTDEEKRKAAETEVKTDAIDASMMTGFLGMQEVPA